MSARSELAELVRRTRRERAGLPDAGPVRMPGSWRFKPVEPGSARRAAVLILFGRLDDVAAHHESRAVPADLDVLFVQRADTLRKHPGQIAFPGGGIDADDHGSTAAALREAREETGLDPDGVEILGELPEAELPVSNFLVTPVIGWWSRESEVFAVDPAESAKVFRVPVADLLDPANRVMAVVERDGLRRAAPAFDVDGAFIWGFTAIVLDRMFDELGWTQPWDRGREVPAPL
ncbi:NUDIX hydrolase [Zafaria sp. Z1313]|uniref:NUDIX hydrolase n=1 Tax=Zafaria sp. Z1313 TaxID=3423202 RepID=UPI003D30273B